MAERRREAKVELLAKVVGYKEAVQRVAVAELVVTTEAKLAAAVLGVEMVAVLAQLTAVAAWVAVARVVAAAVGEGTVVAAVVMVEVVAMVKAAQAVAADSGGRLGSRRS